MERHDESLHFTLCCVLHRRFLLKSATVTQFQDSPMSQEPAKNPDFIHSEEFLRGLMKRQLRLSVTCASAFLLLLFGLPLLNYLAPDFMAQRVWGFTLSWLVLGVLFFPYVWIIARWFIVRSMALEDSEVSRAAEKNR